jgi:hypothetical protein
VTSVDRSEVGRRRARLRAGGAEWPRFSRADFRELSLSVESFDAVL